MEETGEPVYQYYTVINDNVTKIQAKDKLDENQVVYVALSGDFEEASTSECVLNDENDEVKEEPVTLQQEFSTLPTIDTSNVKIITLNDGRVFVTTSAGGSSSEENYETIEPHLISDDVEEEEQTEDYSTTVHSNLKYEIIELVENPIEMVYCDDLDEETHMKKEKKFKCTFEGCTKEYSSSYQLNVHLRSHSTDEKAFKCTVEGCTKRFSTSYSLKAHIRTHTGEKPYGCSACLKNFKTSGDLLKHYRIHTGEKPFVCPVLGCGRSFTTSNIRKVHIRSHTGERPYACTYTNCGKAFSSLTNYKNHIRIHSGEKPYVCTVPECGKRFTEYSSLYKHNMVHQQSRPFVCPFCDQKFKQESAMKVHKRVKHNVILTSDGTEIVVDLN